MLVKRTELQGVLTELGLPPLRPPAWNDLWEWSGGNFPIEDKDWAELQRRLAVKREEERRRALGTRPGAPAGGGTSTEASLPDPGAVPWVGTPYEEVSGPDTLTVVVQDVKKLGNGLGFSTVIVNREGLMKKLAEQKKELDARDGRCIAVLQVAFAQDDIPPEMLQPLADAAAKEALGYMLRPNANLPQTVLNPAAEAGTQENPIHAPPTRAGRF